MNKLLPFLMVAALSGCASTIETYVSGFPQNLEIRYNYMSEKDMVAHCYRFTPDYMKALGATVLACAEVNLDERVCDIYLTNYTEKYVIEHEIAHCKGGDHDGILQRYFDEWRKNHAK